MLQTKENIVYIYNKKDEELIFLFLDNENNSIYKIKGWFGKKLYEILESKKELQEVWGEAIFSSRPQLKEIFQRLLLTLVQENIFEPITSDLSPLKPFSPKERHSFGMGDLTGSLLIEEFLSEEALLAYSHSTYASYLPSCSASPSHEHYWDEFTIFGGMWKDVSPYTSC